MKTLYFNGKVYTGELPFAEAFAVEDGVFTDVGTTEKLRRSAEPFRDEVDLGGRFVCAGFNDSHMHLLGLGQALSFAPLAEHTSSLKDVLKCLSDHLKSHPVPEGGWLRGRGWNQDCFLDVKRMPTRYDLDRVSRSIPIMITRACGHCCVLNSAALELAGIDARSVSPEGGTIVFADGEPNGVLCDNAMELVDSVLPRPDVEGIKNMIRAACRELSRYGVTSVQTDDYCVFREVPPKTVNEAYRELESSGELSVRVYEQCNFTDTSELKKFMASGNVTGKGSAMYRIGPLKLLGDGALGSRTAHLSLPYIGSTDYCGFSLFSPEQFYELISCANAGGMQVAVHAIGDACLDTVLDAFEKALNEHPSRDHRHGIVHCQITREDQLRRIERLGLRVYIQSVFLDYDNHIVDKTADPSLVRSSYAWKTLLDRGVWVSNGSDCPVELPDVMKGMECAVTRTSIDGTGPFRPEEAFTVKEAIDSYTSGGAQASFEETLKGRIKPGYYADFAVLSEDPFSVPGNKLHTIKAEATYLAGKRVF